MRDLQVTPRDLLGLTWTIHEITNVFRAPSSPANPAQSEIQPAFRSLTVSAGQTRMQWN